MSLYKKKQYEIIIENCENDIVVNGCAGSGKTAVLFHKLSYLIFNNPDISLKSIYVISPTNALNLESDELAKELQINAVQRLIIGDFYTNIFVEYCKKYDVFFEESTDTLLKDEKLDDGVAKIIYSKKTITEFVRNIKKILKHGLPAKIAFTEEYNKLIKKFENIAPLNLVAKIKSLKKAIKEAKKESKTRPNNERKLELMNFILNNYECVGIPQYKDTKNNKSKIEINSDAIKEASDEFDKFTKRISKFNGKSLDTKEVLKIILDHRNCAQNASLYEQFVNGDNLCYAAYVINSEIEKFKRMHNIDENNYEFEAFYRVAAMQSLFGKLSEEKIYIYLDEYQNYALEEISLIQKVYGSITWNLFGDMNQKILDKGSRVLRAEKFNWKTFDMNQNYRNAKEITEYANNKFWLSMIPIGIEGSVRELSLKKLGQINDDFISKGRVAIIIKNEDTTSLDYVKDIFHTNREFNVVSDDSNALQEDKINIITVSMSKGLEFENVVVFAKGMTRNEKYVACTRALKNLIVVVK